MKIKNFIKQNTYFSIELILGILLFKITIKLHNNDYILNTNTKLDSVQATVCYLKNLLEQLLMEHKRIDDWITEKEAMEITSLSRGTLLKLRKEGKISSSTLSGKKNYYRLKDFKKLLELNEQKR